MLAGGVLRAQRSLGRIEAGKLGSGERRQHRLICFGQWFLRRQWNLYGRTPASARGSRPPAVAREALVLTKRLHCPARSVTPNPKLLLQRYLSTYWNMPVYTVHGWFWRLQVEMQAIAEDLFNLVGGQNCREHQTMCPWQHSEYTLLLYRVACRDMPQSRDSSTLSRHEVRPNQKRPISTHTFDLMVKSTIQIGYL